MNRQQALSDVEQLWLYRWVSRFKFMKYRTKIMLIAFIGTHIPLVSLAMWSGFGASIGWSGYIASPGLVLMISLLGTGLSFYMLNHLLRPVLMTSKALRAYRETRQRIALPASFTDEVGTLMADACVTIDHLETLERMDPVTGLPNRKRFIELVEELIASGQPFSVVVLRFANFPRIADTMDRGQADHAALTMARRFASRVELKDGLARVGFSKFACLVVKPVREASSSDMRAQVRQSLDACTGEIQLGEFVVKPVLHAGVASYPEDGLRGEALIDSAVAAASQAHAWAPVFLHSALARKVALDHFRIEHDLRQAIARDEFALHYQPVVNVRSGRVVGAEALIRWHHPERGLVPPLDFIGAAEASGLIEPIGLWVLRAACAQVRDWNDQGKTGLSVAINVSAKQFLNPAFKRHILESINDYHIAPNQLEIELTETSAMVDHEYTKRVFTSLRDAGVSIAIDDFGTAYASMSYLRKLPFDKLKIDREFVTDVNKVRHCQAICSALIELAKGLDLKVLAEGTEKIEEIEYLYERECALFQGYYFSPPVPAPLFSKMLDTAGGFRISTL